MSALQLENMLLDFLTSELIAHGALLFASPAGLIEFLRIVREHPKYEKEAY